VVTFLHLSVLFYWDMTMRPWIIAKALQFSEL